MPKTKGKRQRKLKKSLIAQEREMVKNLGNRFDFDVEEGEGKVKKAKPSNSKDDVSEILNQRDAKKVNL